MLNGLKRFLRKGFFRNMEPYDIDMDEFKSKRENGAIIVDVRSSQEYNEGHLPGAINIPEYEIRRVKNEMPKLNQQIVVYCQYGGRSRDAYNMLKKMGYTNVYSLKGGLEMI